MSLKVTGNCDVQGSMHRKYVPKYNQQDAKLHSSFISVNCSTCFGWFPPPIIRNTKVYLQHLVFVKPLLLPAAIVEELELRSKLCKVASCWKYIKRNILTMHGPLNFKLQSVSFFFTRISNTNIYEPTDLGPV